MPRNPWFFLVAGPGFEPGTFGVGARGLWVMGKERLRILLSGKAKTLPACR